MVTTLTSSRHDIESLFPHHHGPKDNSRALEVGELREWPFLWATDPRLLSSIRDSEIAAIARRAPHSLRYFSVTGPGEPGIPLVRAAPETMPLSVPAGSMDLRLPPRTTIRDKFWQRLVVEETGHSPQPGFAFVNGSRVEARNAPWQVQVEAVHCRAVREELLSAAVPGSIIVVEDVEVGFAAVVSADEIRLVSRSPHVRARLHGPADLSFPLLEWASFIHSLCAHPLPMGVTKSVYNPTAELVDALSHAPGAYILKPRLGSNGFCVARIVSHPDGHCTVESDCPDTAQYLEEFPIVPELRGRDLVMAVATHRARFVDRARVGLPEWALDQSILEEEIRQDRAEGSIFEPRVVVQRVKMGSGEGFATLGAICKRIDTSIGASVVRDFREESLEASLHRFLGPRVPPGDLATQAQRAEAMILEAADHIGAAFAPLMEANGLRIHQFGIDCRLCWCPNQGQVEYPFLECQFGIGRIDWPELGIPPLRGYMSRGELQAIFGPDTG